MGHTCECRASLVFSRDPRFSDLLVARDIAPADMYIAKGAHDAARGRTSKLKLDLMNAKRVHAEYSEVAPILGKAWS